MDEIPPACHRGSCDTDLIDNNDEVTTMKLFNVTISDTGEELCVAARTMDHAAEVLVTFWLARTGTAPGKFSVGEGPPTAFRDEFVAQSAGIGGAAGVLVRRPDGSIHFDAAVC